MYFNRTLTCVMYFCIDYVICINYVKYLVRWVCRYLTHFASEETKFQVYLSDLPKVTKVFFILESSFNLPHLLTYHFYNY